MSTAVARLWICNRQRIRTKRCQLALPALCILLIGVAYTGFCVAVRREKSPNVREFWAENDIAPALAPL
jgi:hypothetical protein